MEATTSVLSELHMKSSYQPLMHILSVNDDTSGRDEGLTVPRRDSRLKARTHGRLRGSWEIQPKMTCIYLLPDLSGDASGNLQLRLFHNYNFVPDTIQHYDGASR